MTIQHSDVVLYMAMELSNTKWKLRFGNGRKCRNCTVDAGDHTDLLQAISYAKHKLHLPADTQVVSCYEAGRDGFWIHRFLTEHGIENYVVDPASIEMPRRKRRAKTDRLDVEKLLITLYRYCIHGETTAWRVCRVPSEAAEDERRLERERERLQKERTAHIGRMKSLLVTLGVKVKDVITVALSELRDWKDRPLPAYMMAELEREQSRLRLLCEQIAEIECRQRELIKHPESEADRKAARLQYLAGVGVVTGWTLSKEMFGWREFNNRREVGGCSGLVGSPYDSGDSTREQGITKAGNRRVRKVCIELAWNWLRYQPGSELSRWYMLRFGHGNARMRKIGIVALARKLLVALWKYLEKDQFPEGARVCPTIH